MTCGEERVVRSTLVGLSYRRDFLALEISLVEEVQDFCVSLIFYDNLMLRHRFDQRAETTFRVVPRVSVDLGRGDEELC